MSGRSCFPSRKFGLPAVLLFGALAVGGCGRPVSFPPRPVTPSTTSRDDGMTLLQHPGPEAQLIYADGRTDFFCNPQDLLEWYYRPDRRPEKVANMYVQDMGGTSWQHPRGHWIPADQAYYVIGNRRLTDMGPTFVSFRSRAAAADFTAKYGGRIYRFDQIKMAMIAPTMKM